MAKVTKEQISAKGFAIQIYTEDFKNDYISLTDIAKYKNIEEPNVVVANWMRNYNTIEYLGIWEQLNNPNFNPLEFEGFLEEAGSFAVFLLDRFGHYYYVTEYVTEDIEAPQELNIEKLVHPDDLEVVSEALGSSKPVYPILWKNMFISLIVFTFIAFNMIFFRYILSDSIDSSEDLEELTGVPTLGMIPEIEKKGRR